TFTPKRTKPTSKGFCGSGHTEADTVSAHEQLRWLRLCGARHYLRASQTVSCCPHGGYAGGTTSSIRRSTSAKYPHYRYQIKYTNSRRGYLEKRA
ncbi:hypothetical protein COCVIDRAFT_111801, partial [Bipolaris victoriae FI3]